MTTLFDQEKVMEIEIYNALREGRKEGREEGESKLGRLIIKLVEASRMEDVVAASRDANRRNQLYKELGIE